MRSGSNFPLLRHIGLAWASLLWLTGPGAVRAAVPAHVTGHVLVKFRQEARSEVQGKPVQVGLDQLARKLALPVNASLRESTFTQWHRRQVNLRQGQPTEEADVSSWMYLDLPPGWSVEQALTQWRQHPLVDYLEPDYIGEGGEVIPNDPSFPNQWHHRNTLRPGADILTPAVWDITTGSSNVIVAVLDTGLNASLSEWAGRVVSGFDFVNDDNDPSDDQGHGTWVTGALAATGNNSALGAGVDWNCRIMPVKVLDENNFGIYSDWAQGIAFAVANGAKVINLSAGGGSPSSTLESAINNAIAAGVIFVTITHNDGEGSIRYPGRYTQCITVGATDQFDRRASFSNYGPQIDLVAPGDDILTVNRFGTMSAVQGTSFAAPLVAGVCALMASLNPGLDQAAAASLLTLHADDQVGDSDDTPGFDVYYGHGRLNAFNSILAAYAGGTDLVLTQRESFEPVSVGCDLVYTLVLTNRGGIMASNVVVTNLLPSNVELVAVTTSSGSATSQLDVVSFALGDVPGREQVTMALTVRPLQEGFYTNRAAVYAQSADPLPLNNQWTEVTEAFFDEEGPAVATLEMLPEGPVMKVRFSEPVVLGPALDPNHYELWDGRTNRMAIEELLPGESPDTLLLKAAFAGHYAPFTLVVSGQVDCLGQEMEAPESVVLNDVVWTMVTTGSVWRYFDRGFYPDPAWATLAFDDASWDAGPAQLGYGDGDEATEVSFGSNASAKYITTYFRRTFDVPDPLVLQGLKIRLMRDDGAVVYLNGVEIARQNMPLGTVSFSTLANTAVANEAESEFYTQYVGSSLLNAGPNVLAVEIHQSDPGSSDISFDCELSAGIMSLALPPTIVLQPASQTVFEGDTVEFRVEVTGTAPFGYEWRKFPSIIVPFGQGGPTLTLPNVTPAQAGSYLVFITNAVTSGSGIGSAIARLTVLADADGDRMPDDWEVLHGLNPSNPDDANVDSDGDGSTNVEEYRAGTDPQISDLSPRIESIAAHPDRVELQFMGVAGRSYSVFYTERLSGGAWNKLMDVPANSNSQMRTVVDDQAPTGARYYLLITPQQP